MPSNDQAQPRRVSGVGWSAGLCHSSANTLRSTSDWLMSVPLLLPPQRFPGGLNAIVESWSKLLASIPGFFDDWVFPHCLDSRFASNVTLVFRGMRQSETFLGLIDMPHF